MIRKPKPMKILDTKEEAKRRLTVEFFNLFFFFRWRYSKRKVKLKRCWGV